MPSRLSSLLVRDGLVGVKRMEKAFQRQVIYGGSLDTILLEMNLVPEDRLVQYLALASGLPPAARDEGDAIDPAAVALISRELAEQYRAVPVALEGDAVRVLVCAPLEIAELEDLADLLDRALQPLIAPEYRWNLVFASAYGIDPPARFTTLARMLDVDPGTPAVGRAPSVIIDERAPAGGAPEPLPAAAAALGTAPVSAGPPQPRPGPASPEAATLRYDIPEPGSGPVRYDIPEPGAAPRRRTEETARSRRHTIIGLAPNRARTDSIPVVRIPERTGSAGAREGRDARDARDARDSGPMAAAAPARRRIARPPSAPIATEGRDSPLPVVRAREVLATAADRDTVFLTLLRAARGRARWAGLLTVQGGAAIGRVALAEPGIDVAAVTTVLIPLDVVSPFRNVVSNHQPHIGPLVSGDAGIDAMVLRLGGTIPPSALILPVVLRDRVVAIVVAHRVHSDIRLVDVAELLPMATAASDALGRLIVKHKSAGHRAPAEGAVVEVEAELVDTKRMARPEPGAGDASGAWSAQARGASAPGFELGTELSIDAEPPAPIDDVLAAIEAAGEGRAEEALGEAVERAPEALAALMRRFPGKLRVDRFAVAGRGLRAAQYGGLLELVLRLGGAAAELLIEKLSAPQRDVRFYAAVCAAELRPRGAVLALAERLFEQDFGVRACALEALGGYAPAELAPALVRVRRALHSTVADEVEAAVTAIVALGDVDAIADLIGVIERGDRGGEHARRGLVALTAQDFGTSERKWRKWWEGARGRHRIEWLIEGLDHREDAIREAAIKDLRRITGEHFEYYYDLPRRERDAAAGRWAAWWRDTGQRRFAAPPAGGTGEPDRGGAGERHRPTAKLPPRE